MAVNIQFLKLSHELITDKAINTYEFRIYVYLMSLYNKEKGCSFPSQETIAEKLSIGLTTVKKSIKRLSDLGYLRIEKQKKKIGHYNKYSNFKHLIGEKKEVEEKQQLIVSDYKESGVQIYIDEVLDEEVRILSVEERKQKDIDNNISVRLARKYTDIDSSKFAKELISKLDESLVRKGYSSFKNKLELGKLKENCASNLLKECIDTYFKEGVDLPIVVFNKYRKDYVNRNNILVDEWITEEGISGYSNKLYSRKAIMRIEEMALLGELETLIVFNLDRIGRTTEGIQFIKNMTYSNVKVLSVTEGLLNSGNDTDELINGIKFWMAQQESKKISLRSKNGKEAANKKGLFAGGPVNFGYGGVNQKMFVIPEEAEIVKLIFDLYIKQGKNETVRYLQEKNITKRGRKFSQHMIHDLLKDTIYIGLKMYNQWQKVSTDPTDKKRKFNKETLKFQEYKEELRILDDKTFYKAQELIDKRTSSKDK